MRKKLLLIGVSIALSCLGAEYALRSQGRFRVPSYPLVCARPELYQQYDAYGYRLWPSRHTTYDYPMDNPRHLHVTSNSDGFRSAREFNERVDGRRRVLVVGDSFVFGDGVEEDERFTDVLEKLEPSWRVDNLGMTGYGADLMLRAFENVGLHARPEVVVLSIYADDFRRVDPFYAGVGFPIARYELREGRLITTPYPQWRIIDGLHMWQLLRRAFRRVTDINWRVNALIFDRFRALAVEHDFTLVLVFLPGRRDAPRDRERRSRLSQYAGRQHIRFIDLTDAIRDVGIEETFIHGNWHYNRRGHEIVAHELEPLVTQVFAEEVDAARGSGQSE